MTVAIVEASAPTIATVTIWAAMRRHDGMRSQGAQGVGDWMMAAIEYGIEGMVAVDRACPGSHFTEVRDAVFANLW